jgi:uncharacterized membrane protein YraQ (UPF0718 family)
MQLLQSLQQAILLSVSMFWEVLWPLILGFALSGAVQAVVSHKKMAEVLGDASPKSITLASLFGVASSSCSFAAIVLARSIFRKGASFTSAMVFEIASTNLVIELGIILIVLMGWQFMAAEFLGGIIMVILLALILRFTLTRQLVKKARIQAEKGMVGKMEGHAAMDISLEGGSIISKLLSRRGLTAISHYFMMDLSGVWLDIVIGFLIAGILGAFVPEAIWQAFFFKSNPTIAFIEGPLIGPLVAMLSFVCSVGNVPLAAVLWKGGISFGGVASFIFADLITLPVLDIYRKYYGWKVMLYILGTFYVTMALAGYIVEIVFSYLNLIPTNRNVIVISEGIHWNYTSYLNIVFLIFAVILVVRFLRTGGPAMLKMMDKNPETKT